MERQGIIKVAKSIRKGLTVLTSIRTAKILATVTVVGVVTISLAITAGVYVTIRAISLSVKRRIVKSDHISSKLLQ